MFLRATIFQHITFVFLFWQWMMVCILHSHFPFPFLLPFLSPSHPPHKKVPNINTYPCSVETSVHGVCSRPAGAYQVNTSWSIQQSRWDGSTATGWDPDNAHPIPDKSEGNPLNGILLVAMDKHRKKEKMCGNNSLGNLHEVNESTWKRSKGGNWIADILFKGLFLEKPHQVA